MNIHFHSKARQRNPTGKHLPGNKPPLPPQIDCKFCRIMETLKLRHHPYEGMGLSSILIIGMGEPRVGTDIRMCETQLSNISTRSNQMRPTPFPPVVDATGYRL